VNQKHNGHPGMEKFECNHYKEVLNLENHNNSQTIRIDFQDLLN